MFCPLAAGVSSIPEKGRLLGRNIPFSTFTEVSRFYSQRAGGNLAQDFGLLFNVIWRQHWYYTSEIYPSFQDRTGFASVVGE